MNANDDLGRRVADHYAAEPPVRAPEWVLRGALAAVSTTPQRRTVLGRSLRLPLVPSTIARLGLAAAGVAAVAFVGLTLLRGPVSGPAATPSPTASPSPSPRPSPAAGFTSFTSAIHGVALDYPSTWHVRPATQPWGHRDPVTFDAPYVDVMSDPALGADVYLALVSVPIGAQSASDWVSGHLLPSAGICTSSTGGQGGAFMLDGARGWIGSCGSPTTGGHFLTVATATRGYILYLHVADDPTLLATYDGDFFDALVRTVDLPPDGAGNPSLPPSSP